MCSKSLLSVVEVYFKLMKGKAPRKHSLHEKTAASVLLKLFIGSNEWCHTTDAPSAWVELHKTLFQYYRCACSKGLFPCCRRKYYRCACSKGLFACCRRQYYRCACSKGLFPCCRRVRPGRRRLKTAHGRPKQWRTRETPSLNSVMRQGHSPILSFVTTFKLESIKPRLDLICIFNLQI